MRDTIDMAREAGFFPEEDFEHERLERFEALVRADEREACAKVCADLMTPWDESTPNYQATSLRNDGMRQCAAAIRARENT